MKNFEKLLLLRNITTNKIRYKDKSFRFKKPLHIRVYYKDEIFIVYNEELDIFEIGKSMEDAWISFCEDFMYLQKEIVEEDDEKLDEKALELKKLFQDITVEGEWKGDY